MHKSLTILLLTLAVCFVDCGATPTARLAKQNSKVTEAPDSQSTGIIQGSVAIVHDGDTISVSASDRLIYKVRLAGIDAPELDQAFGRRSRSDLDKTLANKQVTIQYYKTDPFGRFVGKVLLDGRDICLEQIVKGMAWHFKRYEDEQVQTDRLAYAKAERAARISRIGLWADSSPQPPWEFRAASRAETFPEETARPRPKTNDALSNLGPVIGNRRSMVYHRKDCPDYDKVAPWNRLYFNSPDEAERAGFRVAGNCPR
jgi:endonuclease YncB( thermonuclease family)